MTDAGWTKERPTKPGAYWFRGNQWGTQMCVLHYDGRHKLAVNCQGDTELDHYRGEFLGPLSPDTYHQGRVAGELFGLQQGLLIAYIFESGTAKQVIEGIKSRIAEIEQQTQDGKP